MIFSVYFCYFLHFGWNFLHFFLFILLVRLKMEVSMAINYFSRSHFSLRLFNVKQQKKKHPKIKKKRQNDNNNAMKYDYVLNHNYHKAFLKFTICFHFYCYFCACAFFSSFHCFIRISCLQSNSTVIFRVFSFDFLLTFSSFLQSQEKLFKLLFSLFCHSL